MIQNKETPATAMARASGNVCLAADVSEIAPQASEIQTARLRAQFKFALPTARLVAELAFPALDDRRARA